MTCYQSFLSALAFVESGKQKVRVSVCLYIFVCFVHMCYYVSNVEIKPQPTICANVSLIQCFVQGDDDAMMRMQACFEHALCPGCSFRECMYVQARITS